MKKKVKYIRDGRAPVPVNEKTSELMSSNKAKNTKPELVFRKELYKQGIRGYRLHKKDLPGKPDLIFNKLKLAVFINGCFWHRCPICDLELPKSNHEFWENKFDKNVARDKAKIQKLEEAGWNVMTIWECEIKKDLEGVVSAFIEKNLSKSEIG